MFNSPAELGEEFIRTLLPKISPVNYFLIHFTYLRVYFFISLVKILSTSPTPLLIATIAELIQGKTVYKYLRFLGSFDKWINVG